MRKTRMPSTRNPFVSFTVSEDLVDLLCYEEAMHVMLDFTLKDEEIMKLQYSSRISLKNDRFEKAFVNFVKRYLSL